MHKQDLSIQLRERIKSKEQDRIMGTSRLLLEQLDIPDKFTAHQKATLAYFLPLIEWLKNDLFLIADCFQKVLELPKSSIEITKKVHCLKPAPMQTIDSWRIDIDTLVGGQMQCPKVVFEILIQLSNNQEIEAYLKGGTKRVLLEETLCPRFLGVQAEFKVVIKSNDKNQKFMLTKEEGIARVGINTVLD